MRVNGDNGEIYASTAVPHPEVPPLMPVFGVTARDALGAVAGDDKVAWAEARAAVARTRMVDVPRMMIVLV